MYFGEAHTAVDEKGRITVPRKFREIMSVLGHEKWFATRGFDRSIFLFNRDEWDKLRAQVSKYASIDGRALDFRRLFFGSVAEVTPDKQGRMAIPQHLREYAAISKEGVLIGVDDHLELWSKDAWLAFQDNLEAEFKERGTQLLMGDEEPAAAEKGEAHVAH